MPSGFKKVGTAECLATGYRRTCRSMNEIRADGRRTQQALARANPINLGSERSKAARTNLPAVVCPNVTLPLEIAPLVSDYGLRPLSRAVSGKKNPTLFGQPIGHPPDVRFRCDSD